VASESLEDHASVAEHAKADFVGSLVEMIGPKGSNFRAITGYFPSSGYDGKEALAPSGVLHRRDVIARIGKWRDYHDIWRTPEADFEYRAFEAGPQVRVHAGIDRLQI